MDNTGNLPVSVNYAAGLCGLFAGIQALALVNFVYQGRLAYTVVSLLLGLAFFVLMGGLRRGSRAARVGAIVMGGLIVLVGLLVAFSSGWLGLAFMAPGLLLLALLLVPAGARRYFTPAMRRASA
ncbi:MAG TPA: hypothetical protein VF755_19170 [Catenuloplanes sp.]|jgi:hypothetical protein